jgi:toxin ParE1/3/4
MMRVALTPTAEAEVAAALEWYDSQAPRIGERFLAEFKALTARLARNPRQFPALYRGVRRANFRHFPYGLFFRLGEDSVDVFACFHYSRAPALWQHRA